MEHEVRGHLEDVIDFKAKLQCLGFFVTDTGKMEDYIFDHPKLKLKAAGEKLRIRYYRNNDTAQLCWKGKKCFANDVKSRQEIEINTNEPASLYRLVEALGFTRRKTIIRYFETFTGKGFKFKVSVRIEWFPDIPGLYLAEIEGGKSGIKLVVKSLDMEDVFGPYTLNSFLRRYSY